MLTLSDFNPHNRDTDRRSWRLPVLILIVFIAGVIFLSIKMMKSRQPEQSANPGSTSGSAASSEGLVKDIKGSIKPGENISSLFKNVLSTKEILELNGICSDVFPLSRISAGQSYTISLKGRDFERFAYDINDNDQLIISRDKGKFSVLREPIPYTVEKVAIKGKIESSLYQTVVKIGESEGLAIQLADIFAWDIDFFNDIQVGDSFEAVVEKRYRQGQPAGNGRLLAARFTVQDQTYMAFYFKDGNRSPDYFDENGNSLRKAFLKAPLSFRSISSGFNMRRLHPITKRIKAHPAIDYAAPSGTPIHSIGDGSIIFAANKSGNGKCVRVRHPNGWESMYNHMRGFGKKIRAGSKVRQGELIGYVGSTGLSTGPHLDFRLYKNGKPVNPLKVKSPPARPVSGANLANFKATAAGWAAFMEGQPVKGNANASRTLPAPLTGNNGVKANNI